MASVGGFAKGHGHSRLARMSRSNWALKHRGFIAKLHRYELAATVEDLWRPSRISKPSFEKSRPSPRS